MTDTTEARDAFKNRCANAARTLVSCVGYSISRISFNVFAEEDSLEIALREGPCKPDVVISLSNLHHLSVDKCPPLDGNFIDEISLIHLPALPNPWPADAADRVRRFDGLCELAWLRIVGPAEVDAVASILTVYTAMSDDRASTVRNQR
ncbi:hypothetical protein OHT57_01510 [Streptomyces sp. NBC_00285]|uniref:hypothetical protein n=1 Tax=Streptomyces sp. NBC_00285 TaxID=2975700 RepID=UPI002E27E638|nr:hypothetical protein [Streptomyces sp. NBC_00285]